MDVVRGLVEDKPLDVALLEAVVALVEDVTTSVLVDTTLGVDLLDEETGTEVTT